MPVPASIPDETQKQTILKMMADGEPLKKIAGVLGVDVRTMIAWRMQDIPFDNACRRAMETGFEVLADSLLTIPEETADMHKARLKSDNIKWLLAKRAVARYGDRLEVNVNTNVDITAALAEAKARALPIRDQTNIIDAQLVDAKQLSSSITSGLQPVVSSQDKDANELTWEEIIGPE